MNPLHAKCGPRWVIRPHSVLAVRIQRGLHSSPHALARSSVPPIDLVSLDKKWRTKWAETKAYDLQPESTQYVLPMFPYPSGLLHLGHLRVYTVADVVARYRALQGHRVLLPMGWDAFGLPAENAALENGQSPSAWTRDNIAKMKKQLKLMNGSWDWSNEITTCDPEFYKHTQKLFLMLHERGLAYQAEADVNFDPVDQTVLANEQVDPNGYAWRSGARVEKWRLKQWFLRISSFRDSLLQDLEALGKENAWPEGVLAQQKSWLGKSVGAVIRFSVLAQGQDMPSAIEVFTTRPETLFGVQYLALAPTHPVVGNLAKNDPELRAFLDTIPALPKHSKVGYLLPDLRAVNPLAYHDGTPEDVKQSIPIYVAPYVLGDYGEGAVMGVPAHDERDHDFWRQHHYDQPVRVVMDSTNFEKKPYTQHGIMNANSGAYRGKLSHEAGAMLVSMLEAAGLAQRQERWHLRDWLISRQRYWGTPIPVVHCNKCGVVPVPEDELPVTLPDLESYWSKGKTGNPLQEATDWIATTCSKCKGEARRDTDTMDTFVDSSWYFTRFIDPRNRNAPFSPKLAKSLLPVDAYIGGVEHAILHLLYARFIYKFLMTTPLLADGTRTPVQDVQEPFRRLITQGMVHGKTYSDPSTGRFLKPDEVYTADPDRVLIKATGQRAHVSYEKMSKSKHNGVDPTKIIRKHGADATRAHLLFQAPIDDVLNWDDEKIVGVTRWFTRIHDYVETLPPPKKIRSGTVDLAVAASERIRALLEMAIEDTSPLEMAALEANKAIWKEVQSTIRSVTKSYEQIYSLNTVVSDLMRLTNSLVNDAKDANRLVKRAAASALVLMLAPIAPALSEELWAILHPNHPRQSLFVRTGGTTVSTMSTVAFPVADCPDYLLGPGLTPIAVMISGKMRCVVKELRIPPEIRHSSNDTTVSWLTDRILESKEGKALTQNVDLRAARKIFIDPRLRTINYVFDKAIGSTRDHSEATGASDLYGFCGGTLGSGKTR